MSQSEDKVYKTLDKTDVNEKINKIVDELVIQEASREMVNEVVKNLKEEYGVSPSVVRSTASIIHKHNKEEIEEKNEQVEDLLALWH